MEKGNWSEFNVTGNTPFLSSLFSITPLDMPRQQGPRWHRMAPRCRFWNKLPADCNFYLRYLSNTMNQKDWIKSRPTIKLSKEGRGAQRSFSTAQMSMPWSSSFAGTCRKYTFLPRFTIWYVRYPRRACFVDFKHVKRDFKNLASTTEINAQFWKHIVWYI